LDLDYQSSVVISFSGQVMANIFSWFLIGTAALIFLSQIFRKPFWGLALMLASLPMLKYTSLPGNLDFSSITALFGLVTLISYIISYKGFRKKTDVYDKPILISTVLMLILVVVGEYFKPIATEIFFPFTYLQLLILIWLTAQLFTSRQEIETLMKLFIGANTLALLIVLPKLDFYTSQTSTNLRRLSGAVGNANEFSIYLSVAVLMLIYFYAGSKSKLLSTGSR